MLSVVIPSYHNGQCLELVLRSLARQSLPKDDYEVIVVYDGCPRPSQIVNAAFERQMTLRELVLPSRVGRAGARNRGITAATGDRIVLLDNDSFANPRLLEQHAAGAAKDANAVVIGGRHELVGQTWDSLSRVLDNTEAPQSQATAHDVRARQPAGAPWLYGFSNNMSFNRADAVGTGLFDEDFGLRWGGEDLDFSYRLYLFLKRDPAKFVYAPDILCWHLPHYRNMSVTYQDYHDSLDRFRNKHQSYEVELLSGLPEALAGSLADISERIASYEAVMQHCKQSGLCSLQPWTDILESLPAPSSQQPALCIALGTSDFARSNLLTFDYGRKVSTSNLHLFGVFTPFSTSSLAWVLSVDFWRFLRLPDLCGFISESLRTADTLYLVSSDSLNQQTAGLPLDAYSEWDYFREFLKPSFDVQREEVTGRGILWRIQKSASA